MMEPGGHQQQLAIEHFPAGNCDYRMSFSLKFSYLRLLCVVMMGAVWVCHSREDLKVSGHVWYQEMWPTPALAGATSVSVPRARWDMISHRGLRGQI